MKKIFLLVLTAGFIISCSSKKNVAETTKDYTVKQESVKATIQFLASDELKGRQSGSEELEQAADYLTDILVKNGAKPYFATFNDTLSNYPQTTYNIVGYFEGNDPKLKDEFVIFGAHYDHIGVSKNPPTLDSIYNGANDDASGCTVLTELANYFGKTKSNKRSVMICFFSGEEEGLLGSRHLADKLAKQGLNIYTMVEFEMVGVPMQRDILAYLTGWGTSNMGEKFNEYAGKNLIGNLPEAIKYQLFRRSDNYSFYLESHVPSQTLSTFDFTNFDYYHDVKDEFENMDLMHMTSFIQQIIPVMDKMVNAPTKEIVLKEE
ncbi:M28 family peptidase [Flavobacterium rhizosphaerae]|uniref:M28 family peptidase n=1 Tax=Flavobacterium rhizosphaerae TaxID=3163298 RepID=A0ABW8YY63_9FLAO